jgi:Ni,Fe-hydrogenase I small subunit
VMLGLSALDLLRLEELLANPDAPTILWLQGSGCTGCSVSFLNYISTT